MNSPRLRVTVCALSLSAVALALVACSAPAEPQPEMLDDEYGKVGVPVAITSLDWLVEECPALADATAVVYSGGYYGSVDTRFEAPGPHDYWRDLVVTLPDGAVERLVAEYDLEAAEVGPDLVLLLDPEIPSGVLLRSDLLDRALCDSWHWVWAWVSVEHDQIVMTVTDP